jgi:RecB family exonuclease
MIERYVAHLDPSDEPLGVERTVATRTDRIAVSGRIDRLDARGPDLVVVDYKTGRRPLTSDDARGSLQLALYALAASRVMRRPCRRVELHHLPSGEVAAWEHTDESLQRHLRRAEQIAAEAAAADQTYRDRAKSDPVPKPRQGEPATVDHSRYDDVFPPRPSNLCGWCDFARHCPEGQQAAPRKDPWAALAVDVP